MSRLRLLDLVKPFLPILPEVEVPVQKVSYDEKLVWMVVSGLGFYVLNEIPLYGVKATTSYDPLFWLRPVLASTRGSVMELGIGPLVMAGFIVQLLGGAQVIDVNFDYRSDRQLYQSAQKLLAICLTFGQALALIFSGIYGSPSELGVGGIVLLTFQIVVGGLFVIYMDEILQKGYGYGTGVSFFTVLSVSQMSLWRLFSFSSETSERGKELVGAFTGMVHLLWTRRSFKNALMEAFFRTYLPNMFEFYATLGLFALMVYVQGMRIDIPIKSTRARTPASSYPIRLLYTGNTGLLFWTALVSNLVIFSHLLYSQFPDNLFVGLIGSWSVRPGTTNQVVAVSGLAYYLQPPLSVVQALWDPIKTVVYAAMVVIVCSVFSRSWAEHSGGSARDLAKAFKTQEIVIVGHRDVSIVRELKKVIPPAASIGGAVLGLLSVATSLVGVYTGTAVVIGTITVYNYFEILAQEGGVPGGFVPGAQ
uniref:ARAD1D33770p n=1 Tax=Blastobotrys adeninivorans TaxID=409370 RepID=A0A060TBP9_BLAAD